MNFSGPTTDLDWWRVRHKSESGWEVVVRYVWSSHLFQEWKWGCFQLREFALCAGVSLVWPGYMSEEWYDKIHLTRSEKLTASQVSLSLLHEMNCGFSIWRSNPPVEAIITMNQGECVAGISCRKRPTTWCQRWTKSRSRMHSIRLAERVFDTTCIITVLVATSICRSIQQAEHCWRCKTNMSFHIWSAAIIRELGTTYMTLSMFQPHFHKPRHGVSCYEGRSHYICVERPTLATNPGKDTVQATCPCDQVTT